jgi:hypothetical protein
VFGVLEPGAVLYIPRGFAHRAVGAAGLSAHLSLTVRDICLQDLRTALEEWLTAGLDVPARPLGEAAIVDAGAALLDHVRARLDTVTPADVRLAARAEQARRRATAAPAETFAEAARTWQVDGGERTALASVSRTWRKLRGTH